MRTHPIAPILLAPLFATAFAACDPSAGERQGVRAGQCNDDVDATCDDDGQDTDDDGQDTDDSGQDTDDNPHDTDDGVDTDHDCVDGSVEDHCGDTDDDDDDDDADTDDDTDTDDDDGAADLPYDVKLALGDSFALGDAFLEKGPAPQAILAVEMDGGDWRLAELQAGQSFVVDQGDCDHVGNRDVGRDRVFVTWQNADGSQETDHLDLRYCEQ